MVIHASAEVGFSSTAIESEEPVPAGKKQINKRGGAKNKSSTIGLESDSDNEVVDDDDDFEVQQKAALVKKGGRKPAAQNANKASAAPKKRNVGTRQTLGQKLFTDNMLQSAESTATSPEKKVRKMRESPFNKKSSGSILDRAANKVTSQIEDLSAGSASNSPIAKNEVVEIAPQPARVKPHRANPNQNKYVATGYESDNDSDEDAELSDLY